jgi:hypothetical protein
MPELGFGLLTSQIYPSLPTKYCKSLPYAPFIAERFIPVRGFGLKVLGVQSHYFTIQLGSKIAKACKFRHKNFDTFSAVKYNIKVFKSGQF